MLQITKGKADISCGFSLMFIYVSDYERGVEQDI